MSSKFINYKMAQNNDSGYLELILGSMFSGKTSKILEIYKQCKFCNIAVLVINHAIDTRYTPNMLSTHDNQNIPCEFTNDLLSFWKSKDTKNIQVVLINEGQFFENLFQAVELMLDAKKRIYVCGLDGDFKRKKFGEILDLIPICDKVYKLQSLCALCKNGEKGIFSLRVTDDADQTLVGVENYKPVCRKCYITRENITSCFVTTT